MKTVGLVGFTGWFKPNTSGKNSILDKFSQTIEKRMKNILQLILWNQLNCYTKYDKGVSLYKEKNYGPVSVINTEARCKVNEYRNT